MLASIQKEIKYLLNKPTSINKLGFFIHNEYILDHYYNIFSNLPSKYFDIVLDNKFKSKKYDSLKENLEKLGWNYFYLDEILYQYKYQYLITNLYLGGNTLKKLSLLSKTFLIIKKIINKILKKMNINFSYSLKEEYFQKKLGVNNIKFMYGPDISPLRLGEYGNLFDLFFCHGKRDEEIMRETYHKETFIMGYPRYDHYYTKTYDVDKLYEQYGLDKSKKTILWICTVSPFFSTIETYKEMMYELTFEYNILVRPHPLEINKDLNDRFNQKVFDIVTDKKNNFILNNRLNQDMTELYKVADYVMSDYECSPFSALYLNKRLILMNHKDAYKDEDVYYSTSMELRDYLPSINENEREKLKKFLSEEYFLSIGDEQIAKAREIFYGKQRYDNSQIVAKKLLELLNA